MYLSGDVKIIEATLGETITHVQILVFNPDKSVGHPEGMDWCAGSAPRKLDRQLPDCVHPKPLGLTGITVVKVHNERHTRSLDPLRQRQPVVQIISTGRPDADSCGVHAVVLQNRLEG